MPSVLNIVVGVAVVAFIVYRQLKVRRVRGDRAFRVFLILGVVGLAETVQFQMHHAVSGIAWALLGGSLVLGAVLGALRGLTVRVWRSDGSIYRQGTMATLALWIVSIALHIGIDLWIGKAAPDAQGLGNVGILLYVAVTLGVQQLLVLRRAETVEEAAVGQR